MKEEYKTTTNYSIPLKASEYDFLEIEEETSGRIRIKFFDTRWRTKEETVEMLKEIIKHLN